MEGILFVVTHSIMAGCSIWIVVVGMNFKRKENVLIVEKPAKAAKENIAEIIDKDAISIPLKELAEARRLQLTTD